MKAVKEFTKSGLVLVEGDKYNYTAEAGGFGTITSIDPKMIEGDDLSSYGEEFTPKWFNDNASITEFAWRTNTGVKPEFDGEIEVEFETQDGIDDYDLNSCCTNLLNWALLFNDEYNVIKKWRPHLPSMPTETKEEKEALDKIKSPYDGLSCGTFVADAVKRISTPKYDKEFKQRGGASIPEVWVQCAVLYRGGKYTILKGKNGKEYSRKSAQLNIRPFVSERDQAVESLREVILEQQVYGDADGYLKLSTALHDAGYRLQSTENTAI